ncbi:helix-turn-helix domain-containing protein [Nocardia sp. NPDC049707]|uniref:TetR/AcrR family transcriptional regulator n=1 Tax=Nocardia sp. NPDC049707 TaxID=3154735 RepID=UPI0034470BFE
MRREVTRARNRAALLDSAVAVIAQHGYEAARVGAIADAVDLTTGAVYSIFGSKRGLLIAAAQRMIDEQLEVLERLADPKLTLTEVLHELARISYQAATGDMANVRASFQLEAMVAGMRDRDLLTSVTMVERTDTALARLLTDRHLDGSVARTTPEQAARLVPAVTALLSGLSQELLFAPGGIDLDYCTDAIAVLVELIK